MPKLIRVILGSSTIFLITACASGPSPETAAPAPAEEVEDERASDPTTADGIYTAAQAERGQELYREICSECHDTEDWTETGFRNRWEDESVFQLWYYINDRMPYDDPWSLSRQQVTDALTYILQLNGLPAGESELATDDDTIDDYWIVWETGQS